jgi:hypothetical protein
MTYRYWITGALALPAGLMLGNWALADFNARVWPVFQEAGIRIVEIHSGSDLESEYLSATDAVVRETGFRGQSS